MKKKPTKNPAKTGGVAKPDASLSDNWVKDLTAALLKTAQAVEQAANAARQAAEAARQAAEAARQAAEAATAAAKAAATPVAVAPALGLAGGASPGGSADLPAVILAAVAAALKGRPFRMRRIRLAQSPSQFWSQFGRVGIHTSHVIERRN
mgnify:CR=1 FL=1